MRAILIVGLLKFFLMFWDCGWNYLPWQIKHFLSPYFKSNISLFYFTSLLTSLKLFHITILVKHVLILHHKYVHTYHKHFNIVFYFKLFWWFWNCVYSPLRKYCNTTCYWVWNILRSFLVLCASSILYKRHEKLLIPEFMLFNSLLKTGILFPLCLLTWF